MAIPKILAPDEPGQPTATLTVKCAVYLRRTATRLLTLALYIFGPFSSTRTKKSNPDSLREEFHRLIREQDEAMRRAIYVGMTAKEAKEYDNRRNRLSELFKRLYILKS